MRLSLWWYWTSRDSTTTAYHLEIDRRYDRTPVAGEVIDLPTTRFGTAHMTIEHVAWKEDGPSILLGTFKVADGDLVETFLAAGFHTSSNPQDGCHECERRSREKDAHALRATVQSGTWGGLTWSNWTPLLEADGVNSDAERGAVYRMRCANEELLLHLGVDGSDLVSMIKQLRLSRRGRPADGKLPPGQSLIDCLKGHKGMRHKLEISWVEVGNDDSTDTPTVLARLLNEYEATLGAKPICSE
jgi:hypothetical protein